MRQRTPPPHVPRASNYLLPVRGVSRHSGRPVATRNGIAAWKAKEK